MHQRILSLDIRLRVLIVTVGGLLMLSEPAKTECISQNYTKRVDKSLNQELCIGNSPQVKGIENFSGLKGQRRIVWLCMNFGQTIGSLGAATPGQGSLALVGFGAVLVALGFKRRRS
jgi:hypothetical protein